MPSPYNRFLSRLGPGTPPDGVAAAIQDEFNQLHARVEAMERQMNTLRSRVSISGDNFFTGPKGFRQVWDPATQQNIAVPYGADQVKSPDEQKTAIERFKEAFGRKVMENEIPKEENKEEAHPATQTSFVLKI